MLCKFHHALTDGVGGIQIAMHLFDLTEEPRTLEAVERGVGKPDVHAFGPLNDYVDALRYDLGLVQQAMGEVAKDEAKLLFNAIRNPLKAVAEAGEMAASVFAAPCARSPRPVRR